MPIHGIIQPNILPVTDRIRLRKFDGIYDFMLPWYQNQETQLMIDGKIVPYTKMRMEHMYRYLEARGELYYIEYEIDGAFSVIGDVTFRHEDMPILVGPPELRGQGIGYAVITALCQRARELGYKELFVQEIYDFNIASQRCFERAGFIPFERTEKGHRYRKKL